MDLDAAELRVLGCLIEKQRTTPDQYPLSLNALRLACNQTTNRDPTVEYDEPTVRQALDRLGNRGWTRLASGPGSRAAKFRHLFDQSLDLDDAEISLLAEQVPVPLLLLSRLARKPLDQLALGQLGDRAVELCEVCERMQPLRPLLELARCLRPA